jgi:hypothetical protein
MPDNFQANSLDRRFAARITSYIELAFKCIIAKRNGVIPNNICRI